MSVTAQILAGLLSNPNYSSRSSDHEDRLLVARAVKLAKLVYEAETAEADARTEAYAAAEKAAAQKAEAEQAAIRAQNIADAKAAAEKAAAQKAK